MHVFLTEGLVKTRLKPSSRKRCRAYLASPAKYRRKLPKNNPVSPQGIDYCYLARI
jgi:hypothetical protein